MLVYRKTLMSFNLGFNLCWMRKHWLFQRFNQSKMTSKTKLLAEELTVFFICHGEGLFTWEYFEAIMKEFEKHLEYKTVHILRDEKGKMIAAARWNIISDDSAEILDCCVHDHYRQMGVMKALARVCLKDRPMVKWLYYDNKDYTKRYKVHRSYFISEEKREKMKCQNN